MSRFNCTDCCLNDTESCRFGANKSKDYSEHCPDLLVEQNVAYEKALNDYKNKAMEILKTEHDTRYGYLDIIDIREIAKQLKKGKKNDRI